MPNRDPYDWIIRRRLYGQLLRGSRPSKPEEVVAHLLAMQAQDHGHARWSIAQRGNALDAAEIDRAFDDGRILRTHVLRPTWHHVAACDLRWLMRLSGPRVSTASARHYRDLGLDAHTLSRSSDVIAEAVAQTPRTRNELGVLLEGHGFSLVGERLTSMLMHAELMAVICSGPMKGRQHTYAAFDERVPATPGPDGDEALAELAWRYFSTRDPATLNDFSWWSGLRAGDARNGMTMVQSRLASHQVDGRLYWFADETVTCAPQPRIDLIQCYDEIILSYRQTRDTMRTPDATFTVPGCVDGFRRVVLLDGKLLGHWRPHPADATELEIRTTGQTNDTGQPVLEHAIEEYRSFAYPAVSGRS